MTIARGENLEVYNALTAPEIAILIGLGGTLPHNARHRERRLAVARALAGTKATPLDGRERDGRRVEAA